MISEDSISPQRAANKLAPLGWCNACVGEAKQALARGAASIPQVNAAICNVPMPTPVSVPGAGRQVVVSPTGLCWNHASADQPSGIVTA